MQNPKFEHWLMALGAALPLSASAVTSCGIQPPGQTCTSISTTLTPVPSITVTASATNGTASVGGITGPGAALNFDFEVVGTATDAVVVEIEIGAGAPDVLFGPQCIEEGFLPQPATITCWSALIISPGFYYLPGPPQAPLETGQIIIPNNGSIWIVPNAWNAVTLGAGAEAMSAFDFSPAIATATTSMQLAVAPRFPNADLYSIVIASEPS